MIVERGEGFYAYQRSVVGQFGVNIASMLDQLGNAWTVNMKLTYYPTLRSVEVKPSMPCGLMSWHPWAAPVVTMLDVNSILTYAAMITVRRTPAWHFSWISPD
jgi:hypothetical protein